MQRKLPLLMSGVRGQTGRTAVWKTINHRSQPKMLQSDLEAPATLLGTRYSRLDGRVLGRLSDTGRID